MKSEKHYMKLILCNISETLEDIWILEDVILSVMLAVSKEKDWSWLDEKYKNSAVYGK